MPRFVTVLLLLSSFPAMANSADTPEARLAAAGFTLPPPPQPVATYVTSVQTGNLLFLSGHGECGEPATYGKLGADVSLEQGVRSAQKVGLCMLATIKAAVGELSRVKRFVRILGMVQATPDFKDHPEGHQRLFRPDGRRLRRGGPRGAIRSRHGVAAVQYCGRDRGHRRVARRNLMAQHLRQVFLLLLVPAGLYAVLCLLMFLTQRSQMYFPVRESAVPGATPMLFAANGAEIKVWTVERPGPAALLYFGGNAEDVGASIGPFAARLPGHSLFFVNYRGYGGSTGEPSERALVADAIDLYDHLRARYADVSVIGRSLGSGVAVQLASERDVRRLALVTPFDSLVNVARAHFSWLPVGLLMLDRFDSARRAPAITAEALVVIADADEIIPRARTDALIGALPSRPRVVVLEGARHNDIDSDPSYLDEVVRFLGS